MPEQNDNKPNNPFDIYNDDFLGGNSEHNTGTSSEQAHAEEQISQGFLTEEKKKWLKHLGAGALGGITNFGLSAAGVDRPTRSLALGVASTTWFSAGVYVHLKSAEIAQSGKGRLAKIGEAVKNTAIQATVEKGGYVRSFLAGYGLTLGAEMASDALSGAVGDLRDNMEPDASTQALPEEAPTEVRPIEKLIDIELPPMEPVDGSTPPGDDGTAIESLSQAVSWEQGTVPTQEVLQTAEDFSYGEFETPIDGNNIFVFGDWYDLNGDGKYDWVELWSNQQDLSLQNEINENNIAGGFVQYDDEGNIKGLEYVRKEDIDQLRGVEPQETNTVDQHLEGQADNDPEDSLDSPVGLDGSQVVPTEAMLSNAPSEKPTLVRFGRSATTVTSATGYDLTGDGKVDWLEIHHGQEIDEKDGSWYELNPDSQYAKGARIYYDDDGKVQAIRYVSEDEINYARNEAIITDTQQSTDPESTNTDDNEQTTESETETILEKQIAGVSEGKVVEHTVTSGDTWSDIIVNNGGDAYGKDYTNTILANREILESPNNNYSIALFEYLDSDDPLTVRDAINNDIEFTASNGETYKVKDLYFRGASFPKDDDGNFRDVKIVVGKVENWEPTDTGYRPDPELLVQENTVDYVNYEDEEGKRIATAHSLSEENPDLIDVVTTEEGEMYVRGTEPTEAEHTKDVFYFHPDKDDFRIIPQAKFEAIDIIDPENFRDATPTAVNLNYDNKFDLELADGLWHADLDGNGQLNNTVDDVVLKKNELSNRWYAEKIIVDGKEYRWDGKGWIEASKIDSYPANTGADLDIAEQYAHDLNPEAGTYIVRPNDTIWNLAEKLHEFNGKSVPDNLVDLFKANESYFTSQSVPTENREAALKLQDALSSGKNFNSEHEGETLFNLLLKSMKSVKIGVELNLP